MRLRPGLALAASAVVLAGCGTEPEPLEEMAPDVPADLCANVPDDAKTGLTTSANTDAEGGDPTAACSLRSAPGAKTEVRGLVTVTMLNDEGTADTVLDSQCRAIDKKAYQVQDGFTLDASDKACAGSGKLGQADAATLAAVTGRHVITVRWSTLPATNPQALARSTAVANAVIQSLTS